MWRIRPWPYLVQRTHLRGLAEGMKLDREVNEQRLILEMLDVMDEMSHQLADVNDSVDELNEYVEDARQRLSDMEDVLFGDDDCDCDCDCGCEDDGEDEDEEEDDNLGDDQAFLRLPQLRPHRDDPRFRHRLRRKPRVSALRPALLRRRRGWGLSPLSGLRAFGAAGRRSDMQIGCGGAAARTGAVPADSTPRAFGREVCSWESRLAAEIPPLGNRRIAARGLMWLPCQLNGKGPPFRRQSLMARNKGQRVKEHTLVFCVTGISSRGETSQTALIE
ncbi:MAG: CD1247 N-terminal domain-containing protein [Lachnospiraceae bacterium]